MAKRTLAPGSNGLGARVRELRTARNLTIGQVAKASGLASSTISKVENGLMSPTYDKLMQLAEGMQISISELFAAGAAKAGAPVTARRSVGQPGQGAYLRSNWYEYWYLNTDISQKAMVPMLGRTSARSLEEFGPLMRHPGEEFVYVLEGRLLVHTEHYSPVELEAGATVYLDSSMGHAYLSASQEPARFIVVCSDPHSQEILMASEQVELDHAPDVRGARQPRPLPGTSPAKRAGTRR